MADFLVRGLDEAVLAGLRRAAKAQGRSLQAEVQAVLRQACDERRARTRRLSRAWLRRLAGRVQGDSTELIGEDRGRG